ncbi:hypothetical protein PISMIDRAFT_214433 [Pisolithus microcarpus 441]|uniref:Uncharacterized protein n=1 Tax=Pisolithus microcarpus 441 TaxID=765257 RepID=A0A0C9ZCB2_9AGAM|nr:hypothetical protein PISMIDRAFT_214433 [Pisolithus microcarpus 441]
MCLGHRSRGPLRFRLRFFRLVNTYSACLQHLPARKKPAQFPSLHLISCGLCVKVAGTPMYSQCSLLPGYLLHIAAAPAQKLDTLCGLTELYTE